MIEKIDPQLFDWSAWRNGSPSELFLSANYHVFTSNYGSIILRKYAIGYCNGEELICRNKIGHKAVMFLKNEEKFWFHLTNKEFYEIFEKEMA